MHLKQLNRKLRALGLTLLCTAGAETAYAAVNYYECADKGYINATYASKAGVIATSNKGSDINLLRDGRLTPLVKSPGAGMYINLSRDGRYVGFKSINNNADQAPALLDVETGKITLLESYVDQCGQVSFADDGTMAYTMGNTLIVRDGDNRRRYNLGQYINIANISPDGQKVAYTNIEGMMYLLDLASGKTESMDGNGAYRALWSPDNSKLAVQQVNGSLFTMELATKAVHTLGEASSVAWAGNSDELLITRSHRVNELEVKGAEVLRLRYDGSATATIVPLTESTPVSVSTDGNDIMVSYATGRDRGVQRMKFADSSRSAAPASVTSVAAFSDNTAVGGYVATDFKGFKRIDYSRMSEAELEAMAVEEENARMKASNGIKKANDIGLTAIPYINQVWDTPAVGGNYNYGYVCCAPSSSCMLLGWLGYLTPHAVTSRSSYAAVKTCQYSWYVSQQYTSPQTGYTFSTSATGGGYWGYSYGVKGGYGYMWGNGSPASMMASFHTNNGIAKSYFSSSWSVLVNQCNANRPYIICLANGTGGHVVIVFRANQQAANDGSSTWSKTGSFICHDPYGDYNSSSYPNWDGRYSTYDWPGYSNGKANIGTFYWGCVSEFTSGGSTTTDPTITVSPTDAKFSCMLNETPSITFTVTGKDLSSDISIASSHSWRFPVSVSSLSKTGGTFTITMAHSEIAGTYGQGGTALDGTFYVRLKSGDTEKTINITAEVTAPPLEGLTEKWVYSQQRGNASSQGYDMSKIRNFAYNNGKLYCVYDKSKILVLNAQTGESLGFLSNGDIVKGGAVALADVKVIDNVVVASNIAIAANSNDLRLYAWENDNAEPYLLYSTTDFQDAPRLGDCLEMTGSFANDCWFAFANDDGAGNTRIVEYNRKDGAWLAKHTKVYTSAGKQYTCGATVRAYPQGSGWWIDGKNSQAAWTTWDDSKQGAVVQTTCNTDFDRGSSHHEFYWKGLKYAANVNFADISGNNAKMRIIQDKTGDFSSTTLIGSYPSDGLGAVANTDGTGDCMINTDGQTYLEAWVLSTNQGIGYFTVGNPPEQNPDPITPPVSNPTLSADQSELNFTCNVDEETTAQIGVTGTNLKGSITASIDGADAAQFTVSPSTLTASGTMNVTYHPATSGNHTATLTISSTEADAVTITLNGTAKDTSVPTTYALTQDWAATTGHITPSGTGRGWSTGFNGKIYFNDDANSTLKYWDNSGLHTAVASVAGTAITSDEAGNIILSASLWSASATSFKVLPKGSTTWQDLAVTLPEGVAAGATKYLGKAVGDILSEAGGAMLIIPTANSKVAKIHISKGVQTSSKAIDVSAAIGTSDAETFAIPLTADAGSDKIAVRLRSMKHFYHNQNGTFEAFANNGITTTQGGTIFSLCGILYAVEPTGEPYGDGFQIVNIDENKIVATHEFTSKGVLAPSPNCITAEIVNNNTVKLYQYVPGAIAAQYTFVTPIPSGVDNIATDAIEAETEAEYYNLQGIRMNSDNLAPGIYIVRQGNTVKKVLVK